MINFLQRQGKESVMNKKKLNGRSILELVFCSMFVVIGMFCGCLNLVDPKDSRYIGWGFFGF